MTQNFKAPKLRFPGFTEDWEQRKLEESFDFLQNNTLSRAELGDSGTALNVHYGDILVKFGDCIDVSLNELPHITNQSSVEKLKNSYLKDGDVVMADTAEDETVGKCSELTDIKDKIVLSGLHTIPLRPKNKFGKGYLGYYLNSGSYHDQLKPLMQGIKVTSISKSALKNTIVSFPRDVSEQEKIGNFFIRIDNLITLHQRKFETLKKLKKGFLQKMFPKNGESVPEIRFPGFTDAWEQRKLGEISERVQGNDGRMDLPTLTISASNGWMNQVERFSGNIAGKEQKNYTLLKKGQLSYNHGNSKVAKYGTVFTLESQEEALVPRVYHSFRMVDGDSKFIEYLFATRLPDRELSKLISSGARMDGLLNISYEDFMGLKIKLPSIIEQKQISDFFRLLDSTITLHQRKLDTLKKFKQGMLQQMFI